MIKTENEMENEMDRARYNKYRAGLEEVNADIRAKKHPRGGIPELNILNFEEWKKWG